jgi:hypothetical protein
MIGCSRRFTSMQRMLCMLSEPSGTQFLWINGRFLLHKISTCYDILLVIFVTVFTFLFVAYYNRFFCLLVCLSVSTHLTTQRENEFSWSLILNTCATNFLFSLWLKSAKMAESIFSSDDCYTEGWRAHFLSWHIFTNTGQGLILEVSTSHTTTQHSR